MLVRTGGGRYNLDAVVPGVGSSPPRWNLDADAVISRGRWNWEELR